MTGPGLGKNSVQLSDPATFYENYIKLHFDPNHLRLGLNRGW